MCMCACVCVCSPPTTETCVWMQVELHDRNGNTIPEGWGCDSQGKLSTDPSKVLRGGGLVPIGGCEITGQHGSDTGTCCHHTRQALASGAEDAATNSNLVVTSVKNCTFSYKRNGAVW